mgnify:CR=1 FL=1
MAELLLNLMTGPSSGQPPGTVGGGPSSSYHHHHHHHHNVSPIHQQSQYPDNPSPPLSQRRNIPQSSLISGKSSSSMFATTGPIITGSVGIMPDISHLSDVERPIIESVIMRQKKEEEEEAQLLR